MTTIDQLGAWIPQVQGKYINVDGAYGAQCWDLAAHWSAFLGLPVINTGYAGRWVGWAGNMVDAYPQTDAIAAAYSLHGPGEKGAAGDIVVWGDSYWYYPATHVAVLIADKGNQLQCMSQNSTPSQADNPYPGASSGPTTIQSLPRQGLVGFIRPRTGINYSGTTTQEDELSAAEVASIIDAVQKMHDTTRTFTKDRVSDGKNGVIDAVQKMHDTTRVYLKDRIAETSPADLAVQINAAGIAAQVRDELVKLLAD